MRGVLLFALATALPDRADLQAGIIPFDPFKSEAFSSLGGLPPPPFKPQDPPLEDLAVGIGPFVIPLLWGQELVGLDLVRAEVDRGELTPVTVYVADGPVYIGANRQIILDGLPYQRRRLKLRITKTFQEPLMQRLVDIWNRSVPEEIDDPFDVTPPAHPSHGMHVAGLIGSGLEEIGANRSNEIVGIDLFKGVGQYRPENLLEALQKIQAEKKQNSVLNLSVEVHDDNLIAQGLGQLTKETDTLVVLASGNSGREMLSESVAARVDDAIVVGAFGISGTLTSFSNYGKGIDLVAPGESIISRGLGMKWRDEMLEIMTGTSFAAPIVSGTAATIRAVLPQANSKIIREILTRTAIDLGAVGYDDEYGHGLVNSYRAVVIAKRLARLGMNSLDALEMSMTNSAVFETKELQRQARIEGIKAGIGTPQAQKLGRKVSLLGGTAQDLEALGLDTILSGHQLYGMGLMFAAFNYEGNALSSDQIQLGAALAWTLQNARVQTFRDLAILKNLTNPEIIMTSYEKMPAQLSDKLTPVFEKRLTKFAPSRMADFQRLAAEKNQKPAEVAPVVAVNTAP